MSRFEVVGESLIDIVLTADGRREETPGGSSMNVAVGLSRLGVATRLVTEIGDDERGRLVTAHLRSSGVDLPDGTVRVDRRTSTATARLDAAGAASYSFDLTWELPPRALAPDTTGLHVGSLGRVLEPGSAAVRDLLGQARERDVFVSYDPNLRPDFPVTWSEVAAIAGAARVVKLSDEDLRLLRPDGTEAGASAELLAGPATALVVVTRGSGGAVGFTAEEALEVPVPELPVVDTVGAGDSFMAALLAVLVAHDALRDPGTVPLPVLLRAAVLAAAVTCSRRGADPPTRQELPARWGSG